MKFFTLSSIFLLITIQSFAQLNPDKLFYLTKAEKYRRMKNTGTTLTVTGGILMVVGVGCMPAKTVHGIQRRACFDKMSQVIGMK